MTVLTVSALVVSGIVAALHLYFLYLEMFRWNDRRTRAIFGTTKEFAEESTVLAANQGLYNGFLAAGLIIGMIFSLGSFLWFFHAAVIVAGAYGARSTRKIQILYFQSAPALVGLVLSLMAFI